MADTDIPTTPPSFADLVRASAAIGCTSFGGPAGQISLMHAEFVEKRRWIDGDAFLHALNFCHLLPGPEAQQLATYIGWRLHGVRGGLAAGGLFVLPGAIVMLALSMLYVAATGLGWFAAIFLGVKAAVLAIVSQALVRVAGRALTTDFKRGLAIVAFVALTVLRLPFPVVVIGAGAIGWIVGRSRPEWLGAHAAGNGDAGPRPRLTATLRTVAIGMALWAAPLLLVLATLGPDHLLWQAGVFFSKLAVVTFGGAYAVLAYMAQAAVSTHGWLTPEQMADGLGLAETTPGPLIMVTQFVGYLAGVDAPAPFAPMVAGTLAAALVTWVTFVPCFLWIFAFAPWIDRLRRIEALAAALAAITAAVVGVIANLALWFAIHVLFVRSVVVGPLGIEMPVWSSIDWRVAGIAIVAAVLLLVLNRSVWLVLGVSAGLGLATLVA
ncbi:chromate efflux transporter [Sphingomonas donggukensis]|uniref:Chromate efflux transporter n=1 Tax=Sphingomonas donggukensis TaxID=2949093 RepID=A0ABY4TT25_9SPHN|nr:chromate efflux transporter [Sphingomonas donggukensis]URW75551.1 chromate efflux transporter [Sphingomonas donggukensis]